MLNILIRSSAVPCLLVLLYAAFLIVGNIPGASLIVVFMLAIGFTNSRRHRMEMARQFPAHVPGPDNDLGNDWPWKDCP